MRANDERLTQIEMSENHELSHSALSDDKNSHLKQRPELVRERAYTYISFFKKGNRAAVCH